MNEYAWIDANEVKILFAKCVNALWTEKNGTAAVNNDRDKRNKEKEALSKKFAQKQE